MTGSKAAHIRVCSVLSCALAAIAAAVLGVSAATASDARIEQWDGRRAMEHIADQLRFTPRAIETRGHQQTIDYIKAAMAKTAAEVVKTQNFAFKSDDGRVLRLTNIIARFQPQNPRRVIVATHYDSIIHAYRDANNPKEPMPGANNSASGVAVLLETARVLSLLPKAEVGIDMIFFDGEEGPRALGAGDPMWRALGSPHFAANLKEYYPDRKPEKAVVFDMVCDKDLALMPEPMSLRSAPAEVKKFWSIGQSIASQAFLTKPTAYPISDDHTALAQVGIPSFLVIDFDYEPHFNTTQDTLDKCSADSLQAVGRTLLMYLLTP
ncbi:MULTISPECIES: M28 family peptidase [unclassified Bradyrhizobium]|uniref:M28 family peptidase n=1 Tax=unclassified Bradyrhizobium TaxID=2631580 RepID=UPI0028E67C6C|nr:MULTISPECIES: M28 family peptidase [unclassified Bradyrhizobium]